MELRNFRGYKTNFQISGNVSDEYFKSLPENDLGGLINYLMRLVRSKNVRTCLDIGANIGLASLVMAELVPAGTIFSFEPKPETFAHLEDNVDRNWGWNQISPQPFALGNTSGPIKFAADENMSHAAHISVDGTGIDIEQKRVDDFLWGRHLTIDFIKIDVEGFELSVLEGAKETLIRHRPSILLEFNEYAIIENARIDPVDYLGQLMSHLGLLAVVDSVTGEASPLPSNPVDAIAILRSRMASANAIFDLVNHIV